MTQIPIYLRSQGPISRAIRELDQRTRALYPAPAPGMQITRTSNGTISVPSNRNVSSRAAGNLGAVWR